MHYSNQDRRKEARVNVRFPALLSWRDTTGQENVVPAHTFSISSTGVGLIAKQCIPIGQTVKITMDVGGPSGFSWAEIKWALRVGNIFKFGLGVRPQMH
jgi:hypothetical protein